MSDSFPKKYSYDADCLILLAAGLVPAVFFNGINSVKVIVSGVITAVLTNLIGKAVLRKSLKSFDGFAVITGLCVSMLLPADIPPWAVILASFVSVAVGKLPFGEWEKAPFVPAAVGVAFIWLIYPELCFAYPSPSTGISDATLSLTSMLKNGNSVNMTVPGILNIIVGNVPGPIGTTCGVFFLACLIYYLIRNIDSFIISAGFISVCCLFAALFPRIPSGRQTSALMELCGGALLFTAVFLMPYPNIKFKSVNFALYYGMTGGLVFMFIRYFGAFEEGAPFAVLIMNSVSPFFSGRLNEFRIPPSATEEEEV